MGRKIPGRKHRGIRDPEKQAAIKFESIKDKINAPPSDPDYQEVSKTLQKIIDLKNKTKSGELFNRKPKFDKNYNKSNAHANANIKGIPEKPARNFVQMPGETDRLFIHRMNRICTEVVKEAEFEDKYGVDVKRNEDGEVEGVEKRQKDELESLVKKAKKEKIREEKGIKKKKKQKDTLKKVKLSKWQRRKMKLNEKQQKKEFQNIDEFKDFKDKVRFGEVVHAPPSLVKPRIVEKNQDTFKLGNKPLLLMSMFNKSDKQKKPTDRDHVNKVDKKGKRKDLPNSLRRQLDTQQKEVMNAYKKLKSQRYNKQL